jgi:hypothetical protein
LMCSKDSPVFWGKVDNLLNVIFRAQHCRSHLSITTNQRFGTFSRDSVLSPKTLVAFACRSFTPKFPIIKKDDSGSECKEKLNTKESHQGSIEKTVKLLEYKALMSLYWWWWYETTVWKCVRTENHL